MAARELRCQMGLSGEDARQAAIALAVAPACLVVDRALPLRFIALGTQQRDLRPKVAPARGARRPALRGRCRRRPCYRPAAVASSTLTVGLADIVLAAARHARDGEHLRLGARGVGLDQLGQLEPVVGRRDRGRVDIGHGYVGATTRAGDNVPVLGEHLAGQLSGRPLEEALRQLGISEVTFYRWLA